MTFDQLPSTKQKREANYLEAVRVLREIHQKIQTGHRAALEGGAKAVALNLEEQMQSITYAVDNIRDAINHNDCI